MQRRKGGEGSVGGWHHVNVRARKDGDSMGRLGDKRRVRSGEGKGRTLLPSSLPDSSKSPLEKAVDSAYVWIADASASVAESVPPTMDKAR
ncbi:hypothetical protein CLOM_g23743 [Closterium sp. NIES-68]|nr:hypothetical protein CLOM_g23743 [Closterium sp. NIES-68]